MSNKQIISWNYVINNLNILISYSIYVNVPDLPMAVVICHVDNIGVVVILMHLPNDSICSYEVLKQNTMENQFV
jgi:hypothetical protein